VELPKRMKFLKESDDPKRKKSQTLILSPSRA
jgi:hypothetical protein